MSLIPPSVNYTYKQPMDSSQLTRRIQNRQIYSNYIIQNQTLQQGCRGYNGLENGQPAEANILSNLLEGARETTVEERARILASTACPVAPAPAPAPPSVGGSMLFSSSFGDTGSHVSYPNDASLAIGSQEFTIEWFQYFTGGGSFPRPFSIGSYSEEGGISIAVSYEGTTYLWINGTPNAVLDSNPPTEAWTHIAIVGDGTDITFYLNGDRESIITGPYDFTDDTTVLMIGNESAPSTDGNFGGSITNFRWVVGTAVYTGSSFTVPTAPLTDITGTQLLLLATNEAGLLVDSSSASRTPTNTGVAFDTQSPF
jgi:hypothetical protein